MKTKNSPRIQSCLVKNPVHVWRTGTVPAPCACCLIHSKKKKNSCRVRNPVRVWRTGTVPAPCACCLIHSNDNKKLLKKKKSCRVRNPVRVWRTGTVPAPCACCLINSDEKKELSETSIMPRQKSHACTCLENWYGASSLCLRKKKKKKKEISPRIRSYLVKNPVRVWRTGTVPAPCARCHIPLTKVLIHPISHNEH